MTTDNHTGPDGKEIALEPRAAAGAKLHSPSVARNKDPILEAFRTLMPNTGTIVEVGSGTGEHGAFLTQNLEGLRWHPSDPDGTSRVSVDAWAAEVSGGRMARALDLSADAPGWWGHHDLPSDVQGVVSINMIHISPLAAAEGVFEGAAALLRPGGRLFLYGPFKRGGVTAESNERFDADLKRRDPSWGVRDLDDHLQPLAARLALHLSAVQEMPANNLSVVFEKG